MTHLDVWETIEEFAKEKGKTLSGLAVLAGMDSTTFNKSKRFTKYGQERWLSTGSIAKILTSTNSDITDLVKIYIKKVHNKKAK